MLKSARLLGVVASRTSASGTRSPSLLASALCAALATSSSSTPGLFGFSRLQAPADFPRWAEDAQDRCNELVGQVLAAAPDASAVGLVDTISDTICQVYDTAECCRNIHPDPQWQRAATQACHSLSEYLAGINHHEGLYQKLVDVQAAYDQASSAAAAGSGTPQPGHQQQQQQHLVAAKHGSSRQVPLLSRQQLSQLCPDTLLVAAKYRQDFEKFGIHLREPQQRAEVARLLALHQHFPAAFNAALADPKQLGSVAVPSRLVPSSWGTSTHSLLTRSVDVRLDAGSVAHFLATTESEEARQQVYLAGARSPQANLAVLDHMLSTRHQLARLLGHPSYAAFKAADGTLAGTPDAAQAFLVDLAQGCRQAADREVALLTQLKRQHTGDPGAVLQAWDQEFYTRQLAASQPATQAAAAAGPYLQLGSVLSGLSQLLQQLMGLRLQQQALGRGEGWAPGVLKLLVSCDELGPLGVLYLDLLVRPGKVGASGILYPLRCGRALPGGEYQQPVLCLVGNLSASLDSSRTSSRDPTQLLLTWREFRTLVHEMGHAVHSLVSRTRYQHVWGTRCAQDLVEVPSHLWEHFTSHPTSLALLARHQRTRDPLPHLLVEQLCSASSSSVTPALELQHQTLLSLMDLVYHGTQVPAQAGGTSAMWHQVAGGSSSVKPPQDTCPQARFSHLTIYGASYYSYLYARCLSEALWTTHFAKDPLNPSAGHHVRRLLLQPGGAMEPLSLLTASLGGVGPRDQFMFARLGGWCPNPATLLSNLAS